MSKQELGPNQTEWLTALRSGKYEQTKGMLTDGTGFCCLGVACEVFKVPKVVEEYGIFYGASQASEVAPKEVVELLKLKDENGGIYTSSDDDGVPPEKYRMLALTNLNDGEDSSDPEQGKSFVEIADIVEANPAKYFTGPA